MKEWLHFNILKFNRSKAELVLIGSFQQLNKLDDPVVIYLEDIAITAETVCNLVVTIECHLKQPSVLQSRSQPSSYPRTFYILYRLL